MMQPKYLNASTKEMALEDMITLYCDRQENTPDELRVTLSALIDRYHPDGFILLECQMMDSSFLGSLTILPYGPQNTFKTVPTHPVSPRGLASDTSTVFGIVRLHR